MIHLNVSPGIPFHHVLLLTNHFKALRFLATGSEKSHWFMDAWWTPGVVSCPIATQIGGVRTPLKEADYDVSSGQVGGQHQEAAAIAVVTTAMVIYKE